MPTDSNRPFGAADLFRAWSAKFTRDRAQLSPSPEAQTILALMDHFNDLHFNDRNSLRADLNARCPRRPGGVHEPERGGRESA